MFLSAIRPFLRDKSEIQLRIQREGNTMSVTVIPKIDGGFDPDTEDATLAALQAALSKPFHLTIAAADDPDQVLGTVLTHIGQAQAPVHDDLEKYKAKIEADRTAAKDAAEKKKADDKAKVDAKSKKPAPAAKPSQKAPITKSAPTTPDAPAAKPEPVAAADLFSSPVAPIADDTNPTAAVTEADASASSTETAPPADANDGRIAPGVSLPMVREGVTGRE